MQLHSLASTLSHQVARLEKLSNNSPETSEALRKHLYTNVRACAGARAAPGARSDSSSSPYKRHT